MTRSLIELEVLVERIERILRQRLEHEFLVIFGPHAREREQAHEAIERADARRILDSSGSAEKAHRRWLATCGSSSASLRNCSSGSFSARVRAAK